MLAVTSAVSLKPALSTPPSVRHDAPQTGFERVFAARADAAGRDRAKATDAFKAETAPSNAQGTTADAQQPRETADGADDKSAAADAQQDSEAESIADPDAVDQDSDTSSEEGSPSASTATDADLAAIAVDALASTEQPAPTASAGAAQAAAAPADSATMTAAGGSKSINDIALTSTAESLPGDAADAPVSAMEIEKQPIAARSNPAAESTKAQSVGTNSDRSAEAAGPSVQAGRADSKIATDPAAGDSSEPGASRAVQADPSAGAGADGRAGAGDSRSAREFIQNIARTGETAVGAAARGAEGADENVAFRAQVSRGLEAALRHDGGAVTLRLKPESLGALRIDLQVRGGEVAASFQSSTREAHELLSTQLSSLRASLEAKGLSVRAMEVQPPPAPSGAQNDTGASRDPGMQQNTGNSDSGAASGSNTGGHAHNRREDPAGLTNSHTHVALAEVEPAAPGWIRVGVRGRLDAVA